MSDRTHERCSICDWLEREALRTLQAAGTDHWSSSTVDRGTTHTVHVQKKEER